MNCQNCRFITTTQTESTHTPVVAEKNRYSKHNICWGSRFAHSSTGFIWISWFFHLLLQLFIASTWLKPSSCKWMPPKVWLVQHKVLTAFNRYLERIFCHPFDSWREVCAGETLQWQNSRDEYRNRSHVANWIICPRWLWQTNESHFRNTFDKWERAIQCNPNY